MTINVPWNEQIQNANHFEIGTRRCYWRDEDGWQVRVSMLKHGQLRIAAGVSSDDEAGCWGVDDEPNEHLITGRTFKCLAEFAEFVIGWTGDSHRIRQAVEHLLACEYGRDHKGWGNEVACNVGMVVSRWNWDNAPAIQTRTLGEYVGLPQVD